MRCLCIAILASVLVTGCTIEQLPSQSRPSCSWTVQPPADHDAVCTQVFHTLAAVARAELRHDDSTIARLVVNPSTARRILGYGLGLRRQRLRWLHVVPSFTLTVTALHRLAAGFYLLGQTDAGRVKSPETVYLRLERGVALITGDTADEEW